MLQKLRDQTQSLFFKVLVGAIIFTLAIFGFGAFNLFMNPDPALASVNGEDIRQSTLLLESDRERRRIALQAGENFDPSMVDPVLLQQMVLDQLIARSLLTQAANDLDMGPSTRQINSVVTGNPNFLVDGRFDENAYRSVVQMMGYAPQDFLETTGELLVLDQLRRGVIDSAFITDWELRQNARLLSQKRDLAYLPFTVEQFASGIEIEEEAVAVRYQENERDHMTEESVDVEYVELAWTGLLEDPSIEVTEEDLLAAYEADKSANPPEEERDASHILLQVNDERSAEQAAEQLLELKGRLEAGEAFAALAEEFSEDPGSAATGGSLGSMRPGVFVPEFEAALWALEEGELSEPVQTDFGFHLILLNSIDFGEYPEFAEVREEIDRRLRQVQAEGLFLERFRELDSLAFEQPDSLAGLSEGLSLEVRTAQGITREAGSGIFGNIELREAVFTDEVLENGFNSPAIEYVDNRAVVARVSQRYEPVLRPLEEVAEAITAELVQERARAAALDAQTAALLRLQAGESVTEVADDVGIAWQTVELARRNQPGVPREVGDLVFSMQRPPEGDKLIDATGNLAGDRFLVTVTRVVDGDLATMTESEIGSVRDLLAGRSSNVDFEGFYNSLEAQASISRPEFALPE
jgi:peptidyl-prolyl cis-trans isomerase D